MDSQAQRIRFACGPHPGIHFYDSLCTTHRCRISFKPSFALPATENHGPSDMAFDSTPRKTLDNNDVVRMMKFTLDLVSDIPESVITDRSGADGLRKAVLVIQVLSFFVNCIARWAEGLSLSLLEVSTTSPGLCCLATYVAWWSKPLNVAEPTMILPAGLT